MTTDTELQAAVRRSVNLLRAYITRDQTMVHDALAGLDQQQMEHVLAVLVVGHDANFDDLGEPSHSVAALHTTAALAPMDAELAVMTAVHRVATGESGLCAAVADLDLVGQIHTLAVTTTVMLTNALGEADALQETDRWLRTATGCPGTDVPGLENTEASGPACPSGQPPPGSPQTRADPGAEYVTRSAGTGR